MGRIEAFMNEENLSEMPEGMVERNSLDLAVRNSHSTDVVVAAESTVEAGLGPVSPPPAIVAERRGEPR
ncbi:hypothetical protein ACRAR1_20905 [Streptomyces sanyensis]|uniref:hypothetical protein n=1 Tax=Streptomyces sanyensis TaxID=568869 RepID=UPI003D772191